MEYKTRLFVSLKSPFTWLMTLCMTGSAILRILTVGWTDAWSWLSLILPICAALIYTGIVLFNGREMFYKTAIPVWMMMGYFFFVFQKGDFAPYQVMIVTLYALILAGIALSYTLITAEKALFIWWLIPIVCLPMLAIGYLYRASLLSADILGVFTGAVILPNLGGYRAAGADFLMTLGLIFTVIATDFHPYGEYHPTWGDRLDGRRIRTEPPMAQVSPYIMVTRNTSTNYFTEAFEVSHLERYIRQKRKEGLTNFGITHVLLACYCRALCKYPKLNRFIAGQKVFSRGNDIQYCMVIKKEMSSSSPDTAIKVHLSPTDTASDVYYKLNKKVEEVKNTPLNSGFDHLAQALTFIPGVFLKFVVWLLRTLDYFGLLPGFLMELSPFHGSVFFTSMGSLGIPPIYHHLYDFGNLPVFGSFGCKRRTYELCEDGTVVQRKYVDCKFCLDERIVDGFYYAAFFKHFSRILAHPEILDQPPEEVLSDIE